MISWEVDYLLCGKFHQRVVVAKDEVAAWVIVFRSHYITSELLEVRRLG
jgi:hypothetical protein